MSCCGSSTYFGYECSWFVISFYQNSMLQFAHKQTGFRVAEFEAYMALRDDDHNLNVVIEGPCDSWSIITVLSFLLL